MNVGIALTLNLRTKIASPSTSKFNKQLPRGSKKYSNALACLPEKFMSIIMEQKMSVYPQQRNELNQLYMEYRFTLHPFPAMLKETTKLKQKVPTIPE